MCVVFQGMFLRFLSTVLLLCDLHRYFTPALVLVNQCTLSKQMKQVPVVGDIVLVPQTVIADWSALSPMRIMLFKFEVRIVYMQCVWKEAVLVQALLGRGDSGGFAALIYGSK
jgi:hypothetical protein